MTLKNKSIAWWDLETTGNQAHSDILEVGIVVTDMGLNVLGYEHWLNATPMTKLRILDIDPIVLDMHTKSGLWADLKRVANEAMPDASNPLAPQRGLPSIGVIDANIAKWLMDLNGGTQHMAFAGSGVGHFDRQYINRDLPLSAKLMTYWPLDIGVVRRMNALAQIDADLLHQFTNEKPHRALHDAFLALQEARAWVNRSRELRNLEPWEFSDGDYQ
jgi:oligoribonuclease (3'-5' exoribonuclease)